MGTEGIRDQYINPYTDFGFKLLFGTPMNKELFEAAEIAKFLSLIHISENFAFQGRRAAMERGVCRKGNRHSPVSYTHLDVYKRQPIKFPVPARRAVEWN